MEHTAVNSDIFTPLILLIPPVLGPHPNCQKGERERKGTPNGWFTPDVLNPANSLPLN